MAEPLADSHAPMPTEATTGPPPTPRWAKVFGIVALVVVLVTLVELVTSGPHRPGMPGVTHGGTPATSVVTPGGAR